MREVLIVVGAVVVTAGVLALWTWALGRIEERDPRGRRRAAERPPGTSPPDVGDAPWHIRRRNYPGGDGA